MRLRRRPRHHGSHGGNCRLCLGSGKVPYMGNHFDLWMVPCHACQGARSRAAAAG